MEIGKLEVKVVLPQAGSDEFEQFVEQVAEAVYRRVRQIDDEALEKLINEASRPS